LPEHLPLVDAHCHLDENDLLLEILKNQQIPSIINCQTVDEYRKNRQKTKHLPFLHLSAGIHPWDAAVVSWDEMLPILAEAMIIGEIGMDSLWTDVALPIQEDVFRKQLDYASHAQKPVILHTKNQEQHIAEIIRDYPNRYLVHWYSADDFLTEFIDLDCYFTIGPSLHTDSAVRQVAETVPVNRLLMESDGLSAISWATGQQKTVTPQQYLSLQTDNLVKLSRLRQMEPLLLAEHMRSNLNHFISADHDKDAAD